MRYLLALLLLVGCGNEDGAVLACADAIPDIDNIPNVEAKCDHLSQANQRKAADIATKKDGLIIYLPPYEAKAARQR